MEDAEEGADDLLEEMERALTTLTRQANLPRLHEQLAARAGVNLMPGGYGVLQEIGRHGPLRLSELAERLAVDLSTVSRHVKQIDANGLVRKSADPDDGRAALLQLSASGRRALRKLQIARREWMRDLVQEWTIAERRQFTTLLRRFVESGAAESAARRRAG